MNINKNDILKLAKDIRIEFLGNEALIVNLEEETIFSVNDTSANILKIISEGNTYGEVKNFIETTYGINFKDKENEIEDFLSHLLNEGILVKHGN